MTKQLNILVVDDDVENAVSLAELFQADDHVVTIAHDGQEAVEAFERRGGCRRPTRPSAAW